MAHRLKSTATIALLVAGLSSCGTDGRPCVRGHDQTYMQPMSFDGKTTTFIPETEFVCDEYGPAPTKAPR